MLFLHSQGKSELQYKNIVSKSSPISFENAVDFLFYSIIVKRLLSQPIDPSIKSVYRISICSFYSPELTLSFMQKQTQVAFPNLIPTLLCVFNANIYRITERIVIRVSLQPI